jgi:hypothetical protein
MPVTRRAAARNIESEDDRLGGGNSGKSAIRRSSRKAKRTVQKSVTERTARASKKVSKPEGDHNPAGKCADARSQLSSPVEPPLGTPPPHDSHGIPSTPRMAAIVPAVCDAVDPPADQPDDDRK